jgi:hypothetical protein
MKRCTFCGGPAIFKAFSSCYACEQLKRDAQALAKIVRAMPSWQERMVRK